MKGGRVEGSYILLEEGRKEGTRKEGGRREEGWREVTYC